MKKYYLRVSSYLQLCDGHRHGDTSKRTKSMNVQFLGTCAAELKWILEHSIEIREKRVDTADLFLDEAKF
jgi:hypothetical protein